MARSKLQKQRIRSLFVTHIDMLILSLGSSIIFTGVWPYLVKMEPNVTLDQYGLIVAADAFAGMVAAPIFGMMADKLGAIRLVCLLCSCIFLAGNILYSTLSLIPRGDNGARVWGMFASRFIVGTAVNSATRAYISKVTTIEERTTHVALHSLFQTMGFIMGPAFQAALTPLGNHEIGTGSVLVFDMFTATGWVSTLGAIITIVIFLPGVFVEFYSPTSTDKNNPGANEDDFADTEADKEEGNDSHVDSMKVIKDSNDAETTSVGSSSSSSSMAAEEKEKKNGVGVKFAAEPERPVHVAKSQKPRELLKQYSRVSVLDGTFHLAPAKEVEAAAGSQKSDRPDIFATITCTFCFFSFFCTFATLEVLMTPMASDHWGWEEAATILYLGIILAAGGVLSAFCFALIGPLSKRVDERILLIVGGILIMIIGRIVMFPFPGVDKPPFRGNYTECDRIDPNDTMTTLVPDSAFGIGFAQSNSLMAFNMDDDFDDASLRATGSIAGCAYCWCLDQPRMTVVQFIIGLALTMIGYPFSMALIGSIFSKVLGNAPQGLWMGILTTAGCVARVVGPILFTLMYEHYGTYITFGVLLGLLALSFVMCVMCYNRFVPRV